MIAEKAKPRAARKIPAVKAEGLVGKVRKKLGLSPPDTGPLLRIDLRLGSAAPGCIF
jgi:hypothetical protein